MKQTKPKVFLLGESVVNYVGLQQYLNHVGAPYWTTDAQSSAEELIEVMGRMCYRSFAPGLNPNVTKIREGNAAYMANILATKHGSILEHPVVHFIFADVSRVFTHELVRHRVGVAMSQESFRYVRLDALKGMIPDCISENQEAMELFVSTFEHLENVQLQLAEILKLDAPGLDFSVKKQLTSAMRRVAPIGLATAIGWTANLRTLRWLLELRTHPSAEVEIREVFAQVGEILLSRYPNAFGDFEVSEVDGINCYTPKNSKI